MIYFEVMSSCNRAVIMAVQGVYMVIGDVQLFNGCVGGWVDDVQ